MFDHPLNRRLDDLLSALCDGRISEADHTELDQWLRCDPEARQAYLAYIDLHTNLAIDRGVAFSVRQMSLPQAGPADGRGARYQPFRLHRALVAAAAVLLLAAAIWFVAQRRTSEPGVDQSPTSARAVAMLTNTQDAVFANTTEPMKLGGDLSTGPIELTAGKAQVMFQSGAVVDLAGPCAFELTGPNRGKLIDGRLEAYVPEQARGFTVTADRLRVVDLGTKFTLAIDETANEQVRVLQGRVRVEVIDTLGALTSTHELGAYQVARWSGAAGRLTLQTMTEADVDGNGSADQHQRRRPPDASGPRRLPGPTQRRQRLAARDELPAQPQPHRRDHLLALAGQAPG